ncbi:hypothetical protein ZYGR_0AK01730 [Zygosaccharomyces rouxii]|uniref:Uncharacterized protein n=1 Tax=Zygosaccharomyces rouxii TaxID=4956 RepID=A0A1Q3ADC9_ZYGRO|nr:hypothetical protein ZYGR_0AK01730 [Zygosaccharomyces rouxii]
MTILWQEARSYVASGRLELLKRSPKGTEKYRKHKQKLTGDISVDVCGKLGWDLQEIVELNTLRFPDPVQKLEAAFSSSNWFKTTVNDFPYDFQRGIHHLLVWSKISLPLYLENSETIQNDVYNKISNFLKYNLEVHYHLDSQDYLFFINYSNLQSVKAISHIHLLLHTDDSVADKILSNQLAPYIEY